MINLVLSNYKTRLLIFYKLLKTRGLKLRSLPKYLFLAGRTPWAFPGLHRVDSIGLAPCHWTRNQVPAKMGQPGSRHAILVERGDRA